MGREGGRKGGQRGAKGSSRDGVTQGLLWLAGVMDVTGEHFFLPGLFLLGLSLGSGRKPMPELLPGGLWAFPGGSCVPSAACFWIPQAPNNTVCRVA